MARTDQRPPTSDRSPQQRAARPARRPGLAEIAISQALFLVEGAVERVRPWRGWRPVARVAAVVFAVALPVALVGASLRLLFTTPPLYDFAVRQYDVPAVTGVPRAELDRANAELRDYFTNDQRLLRITVTDDRGRVGPLFTPREVVHMRDVKVLVQAIFTAGTLAAVYVAVYAALRVLVQRRAGLIALSRLARASMLATLAFAAAFGVTAFVGFDQLFTRFHLLSFDNDYWLLDPSYHRLVQMFPWDFWFVSTVVLAGMVVAEVLLLLSLAWWTLQNATPAGDDARPAQ
jgi:integral membrane protein (TIGR01906 family)